MTLEQKEKDIVALLKGISKTAVAFSGGVDSALLLYMCKNVAKIDVIAITANCSAFPKREKVEADDFCKAYSIEQIKFAFDQMGVLGFSNNTTERCYLCKKAMFESMLDIAHSKGYDKISEGSNLDDKDDYRPGMKAIKELGILSPLSILSKNEIRALSKKYGLSTAHKPSFACLATRIPYNDKITEEKLIKIDTAEQYLIDMGFSQVRVRMCKNTARIEILPPEFSMLTDNADKICKKFKSIGFEKTTMDLAGYKTGSMNSGI